MIFICKDVQKITASFYTNTLDRKKIYEKVITKRGNHGEIGHHQTLGKWKNEFV